jgi:hypothetical protein
MHGHPVGRDTAGKSDPTRASIRSENLENRIRPVDGRTDGRAGGRQALSGWHLHHIKCGAIDGRTNRWTYRGAAQPTVKSGCGFTSVRSDRETDGQRGCAPNVTGCGFDVELAIADCDAALGGDCEALALAVYSFPWRPEHQSVYRIPWRPEHQSASALGRGHSRKSGLPCRNWQWRGAACHDGSVRTVMRRHGLPHSQGSRHAS